MNLNRCIHQFFVQYLPRIKGCSGQTIKAYRDTFKLFLPFAADYHGVKIKSLAVDHLTSDVILDFLDHLQSQRGNQASTRNQRLAAIKSLAKMIRFMVPEKRKIAEMIRAIPQKRMQRPLIGFLYPDEISKVYQAVDLYRSGGMRDYTILHLLYDSGARASEIATLKLDYFDPRHQTLAILGKADRYRQMQLWPKTAQLMETYIAKHRTTPNRLSQKRLFINQRGDSFTRHGINRICKKYLKSALDPKRLTDINPVHSFRHSCAVRMLSSGDSITAIKNRLGHENLQSTMTYLDMDLSHKRSIQEQFVLYNQSLLGQDPKLDELIGWEDKQDMLAWLDTL
ncbi:MAG: tyrosine-type recombinase/integrase [Deltaproteobacteria bacterium]|nr:tyrosine-type recombinase/integrase [Deltaproteobacteria bacterium]